MLEQFRTPFSLGKLAIGASVGIMIALVALTIGTGG